MNASLVAWAVGLPFFALALSLLALHRTRREAAEIRALDAAEKKGRSSP